MKATASDMVNSLGLMVQRRPPESVDVDSVGHFEDMRHVVRDQHDRKSAPLDVEDQLQHAARFLHAKSRSGLVHDDDLRAEGRGARHGDALALAA